MIKHLARLLVASVLALAGATAGYAAKVEATVGDLKYSLDTDSHSASVTGPVSTAVESVVIPEFFVYEEQEYHVDEIAALAFNQCTSLSSVAIGELVDEIGHGAFRGCTSLTSITIPSVVVRIGMNITDGCSNLRSIEVNPGNTNYASYGGALYNKECTTLILYPAGNRTFAVSPNCTEIGDNSCAVCMFTDLDIPDNVSTVGHGAFQDCTILSKKVTIGTGVSQIGDYAFRDCPLTDLTVKAVEPPFLESSAISSSTNIYVPAASVERYKSASGWSDFADKIQAIAAAEPKVEIKCDYTGCIGDSQYPIFFNEIQIFEDGVVVTDAATIKENLQVKRLSGDASIIHNGMSLNFVQLNVNSSSSATEGEFKVSYKGVERTFTYAFYNVTSEVVPAEATLKVGESVTFSMKLTLSIPGKEDKVVDATSVSYYLQKNGSNMFGSYGPFGFEKDGTTATLTALEGPDGSSYRVRASGNYEPDGILSQVGSDWIDAPVTIEAAAEPTVEIKCDYTGFMFNAKSPSLFSEIQIVENGVVVTDNETAQSNLEVSVLSGDANIVFDGVANKKLQLYVSGPASEGEFKVSYKGVERTFTYARYNVTAEVVPAGATLKVGESVTFSMKLTLSVLGKEDKVVDATRVNYYLLKNGSYMSAPYNPFKFEKDGTTATLTALEGPDGNSYSFRATGAYQQEGIFGSISSPGFVDVPVTIEAAEVALAVKLPNGAVEIKGADKSETPIAIIADEGWKISTVTLGGVGITDDIDADGSYIVPVLTESKELNVVFIEDTTLGVAEVEATAAPKVYVADGRVRVEGAEGR